MPKPRILVIDDDAGIRESLKMTLEYDGYEVSGAATGQEGLALVERVMAALTRTIVIVSSVPPGRFTARHTAAAGRLQNVARR